MAEPAQQPTPPVQEIDPAQQSLTDSLRFSFTALKVLIVVLIILYFFSGMFIVRENEVAIVSTLGRITGSTASEKVLTSRPTPYFVWPSPISQVYRVSTKPQQLTFDKEFMYEIPKGREGATPEELAGSAGPLNPLTAGALLTADQGLVHAKFSVRFIVGKEPVPGQSEGRFSEEQCMNYFRNVGSMQAANELMRVAVEEGMMRYAAQTSTDDLIKQINSGDERGANRVTSLMREEIQAILDEWQTGLMVISVDIGDVIEPLAVMDAFDAASNAEAERDQSIKKAEGDATQQLKSVAGEGYQQMIELVNAYEELTERAESGDPTIEQAAKEDLAKLEKLVDYALGSQSFLLPRDIGMNEDRRLIGVDDWLTFIDLTEQGKSDEAPAVQTVALTGQIASTVLQAVAYAEQTQAEAQAMVRRVEDLAPAYRDNRVVVIDRKWNQMIRRALSDDSWVPRFFLPEGGLYIELGISQAQQNRIDAARTEMDDARRNQNQ